MNIEDPEAAREAERLAHGSAMREADEIPWEELQAAATIYDREAARAKGFVYLEDMYPMDPTANLKEQLELANEVMSHTTDNGYAGGDTPERLAELVLALNEWISKGGFLPSQWGKKP